MIAQCPYCQAEAKLVGGKAIYPHRPDLYSKKFWQCEPCDAYVGCHPNTEQPMGRLANLGLRQAKVKAHAYFDPLWKGKLMTRSEAYAWLAKAMGLKSKDCHIGLFDETQCGQVVAVITQREKT